MRVGIAWQPIALAVQSIENGTDKLLEQWRRLAHAPYSPTLQPKVLVLRQGYGRQATPPSAASRQPGGAVRIQETAFATNRLRNATCLALSASRRRLPLAARAEKPSPTMFLEERIQVAKKVGKNFVLSSLFGFSVYLISRSKTLTLN